MTVLYRLVRSVIKLLKLDLSIDKYVPISDRFFDAFKEFKAIKKLIFNFYDNTVLNCSVECFKHCKQLKYLDITYPELTENFFAKHRVICTETTIT